jgi:hypothetical protein
MPPDEEPSDRRRRTWTLVPRSRVGRGQSFWSTSAGIATTIASLLTAVTGLIVALNQVGVLGGDAAAIPVVPTMTASTVPAASMSDAEEQRLLEHVPGAFRDQCGTTKYHGDRALAAVDCSQSDVDQVHYELYGSKAELDAHYAERVESADGDDGSCEKGEPGRSDYADDGGRVVGNAFCYRAQGQAWMEWTSVPTLIYAYAARRDEQIAPLYRWWLDVPGPI